MIYQTLLSAAVIACMLLSEPIVCLASTQNVAKIKDILCVLILNGVEKDDLDENTLRKLEKMHVNINDWNNVYKQDCEKNIGSQPSINREHWTDFGTKLPEASTTDKTIVIKPPNLIQLPNLEEMLNRFQTTNISDTMKVDAIIRNRVQTTTISPDNVINNNNLDNVLNFWNQFRQDKDKPTIITTTTAATSNKYSASRVVKNGQLEKPKMVFEYENTSTKTNTDYSIEKPQFTLTSGAPNINNQFKEYAEFFDVMYKKFLGLKNQETQNQAGLKKEFGYIPDFQNISPKNIGTSTESYQQKLSNIAMNTWPAPMQNPYATSMSAPIHILQVKPITINYVQANTTKVPEKNGTQIYSETVKEIANEVKAMLLAQLKKEIPLIALKLTTEAPTTTITTPTTTTSILPIKIKILPDLPKIIYAKQKESSTRDQSPEFVETRKKLDETNGMVKKLFGLFQKLEVVEKKTFSTYRPMLAPRNLPLHATTSTNKPTEDRFFRTVTSKSIATNINSRLDPYQPLPMFSNMPYNNLPYHNPYHNIQYNNMQYSVLPPKPMSPYLQMPRPMSYPKPPYNTNPPKIYNTINNPMENPYNYKMIKPSMVNINAKMIQTNEFIVMPLRVPINVKGQREDVQRLIDNQNIILNNTVLRNKPKTTTTTTTPTTTIKTYDTKPERNSYEWKKNTNLENSREREKFIESMDRDRTIDSREREKPRYNSREGRDDRTQESIKMNTNYHHLPRSHFKKTSQLLAERERKYERHPTFQSDENPIHNRYHDDYKGPKYQPDTYVSPHVHGHRGDYHPHPKISLDDTRDPIRDDKNFYNREPPPREKTKFYNRVPVKDENQFFNREPLRDEHKHFNREPTRDEPKHFNRESQRDEQPYLEREEPKFYNIEPRPELKLNRDHTRQQKVFNLEPPRGKYEKQKLHDPRDPIETSPISDSFEKLINGESPETKKDYPHRDIAVSKTPPVKASKFNEKHFKNFLSTQQKVNSMLEKILSAKTQGARI